MGEEISFFYNKFLVYTKRLIWFVLFIVFMVLSVKVNHDYLKIRTMLAIIAVYSFHYFRCTFRYTSFTGVYVFLKVSSKGILYNYLYSGRFKREIIIAWEDIVEIKKIDWLFSKNIHIYYTDNFEKKIKKQKIKVKNSECSCNEIYNILILKKEQFKSL